MLIVDAQVHFWAANTPERPWPARAEPHRAPLGKDELPGQLAHGHGEIVRAFLRCGRFRHCVHP
jgi:hypothetical protein